MTFEVRKIYRNHKMQDVDFYVLSIRTHGSKIWLKGYWIFRGNQRVARTEQGDLTIDEVRVPIPDDWCEVPVLLS